MHDAPLPEGPSTRYQRAPSALWRTTPGGMVLLTGEADAADDLARPDPSRIPQPVFIEGTVAVVWELLAEPISMEDLGAAIGSRFGVDPATVVADVGPLLSRLVVERAIVELPRSERR